MTKGSIHSADDSGSHTSLSAAPKGGGCGEMDQEGLRASLILLPGQFRHGRMQRAIARHYLPAIKIQHVASVVCQLPPSFLEYHTPRSQIPRPDAPLVVAVYPPRSHVAQPKRRMPWVVTAKRPKSSRASGISARS